MVFINLLLLNLLKQDCDGVSEKSGGGSVRSLQEQKGMLNSEMAQGADHELRNGADTDPLHWTTSEPGGKQDSVMGSTVRTKLSLAQGKCMNEKILQEAFVRAEHQVAKNRVK